MAILSIEYKIPEEEKLKDKFIKEASTLPGGGVLVGGAFACKMPLWLRILTGDRNKWYGTLPATEERGILRVSHPTREGMISALAAFEAARQVDSVSKNNAIVAALEAELKARTTAQAPSPE